ncbi:hypothetical protein HMPREF3293_00468 [Christensenella minuta]|uniref:Uncharacterized protein n=2 Tax=Christensenella minuta TaxID=626937 RepID=A0A136Q7I4_9FIRM|nr:hypothetical protein HMPREF3293_00468 [Christensenella minuta]
MFGRRNDDFHSRSFLLRTLYQKREVYAPEKECIIANKHKQEDTIMTMHGHRSARRGNQMRQLHDTHEAEQSREREQLREAVEKYREKERGGAEARKYEPKEEG